MCVSVSVKKVKKNLILLKNKHLFDNWSTRFIDLAFLSTWYQVAYEQNNASYLVVP